MIKVNQDTYYRIAEAHHLPVFNEPWWLDSVAPGSWHLVGSCDENFLSYAVMPVYAQKSWLLPIYMMPSLTPHFKIIHQNLENNVHHLDTLTRQLRRSLVSLNISNQSWIVNRIRNAGFHQQTRYSYFTDFSKESSRNVVKQWKNNVRKKLGKAKQELVIEIEADLEELHQMLERSGRANFSFDIWSRLDAALEKYQRTSKLVARDRHRMIHGFIYLVWDHKSIYSLITGRDRKAMAGTMSVLFEQAMTMALHQNKIFDFEGSMIPNVAKQFMQFASSLRSFDHIYGSKYLVLNRLMFLYKH